MTAPSTPTPRTDRAELDNAHFSDWGTGPSGYVRRKDMETLERELAQAKAALGEVEKLAEKWEAEANRLNRNGRPILGDVIYTRTKCAAELRAALREPVEGEPIPTLMRFYSVCDLRSLALKQYEHITRLQAKLPKQRDEFPRTPREG